MPSSSSALPFYLLQEGTNSIDRLCPIAVHPVLATCSLHRKNSVVVTWMKGYTGSPIAQFGTPNTTFQLMTEPSGTRPTPLRQVYNPKQS